MSSILGPGRVRTEVIGPEGQSINYVEGGGGGLVQVVQLGGSNQAIAVVLSYGDPASGASLNTPADLDIVADVQLDEYPAAEPQALVTKLAVADNQRSWILDVTATGLLRLLWSEDGVTSKNVGRDITGIGLQGGDRVMFRAQLDVDNGAGGHTVTLSYSLNGGETWTEIDAVTNAGTTSVFASNAPVMLGDVAGGAVTSPAQGMVHGAVMRPELDGPPMLVASSSPVAALGDGAFTGVLIASEANSGVVRIGSAIMQAATISPGGERELSVAELGRWRARFISEGDELYLVGG